MGSSKKTTVGYWYHPAMHFGFCQGPIDAFLQFRGGDRAAWEGELTASGEIYVDAPELWGGTESEGGIQGYCDVMFGEQTQAPNAYLLENFGGPQSAFRGKSSLVFKGGRYGAMNPYPKPASFKLRRILKGWDGDVAWYPETASVSVEGGAAPMPYPIIAGPLGEIDAVVMAWSPDGDYLAFGGYEAPFFKIFRVQSGSFSECSVTTPLVGRPQGLAWSPNGAQLIVTGENGVNRRFILGKIDDELFTVSHTLSEGAGQERGAFWAPDNSHVAIAFAVGGGAGRILRWSTGSFAYIDDGDVVMAVAPRAFQCMDYRAGQLVLSLEAAPGIEVYNVSGSSYFLRGDYPALAGGTRQARFSADGHLAFLLPGIAPRWGVIENGVEVAGLPDVLDGYNFLAWSIGGQRLAIGGQIFARIGAGNYELEAEVEGGVALNDTGVAFSPNGVYLARGRAEDVLIHAAGASYGLQAMNPAHIIYDSLVSQNMQGEPSALINLPSFTAAANTLFEEGVGLCTKYDPAAESVEEFRSRICAVIGASCSRSRVNGQWYLDLIRGDYVLADLPILSDDDILEYQEEPTTLDDAVNQVVIAWFDPQPKEDRSTAPLHALGAIQATGGIVSETIEYREIPVESLALRAGARELRNKATPLKRFQLVCNRTPYAWRIGQFFRLQVPKRGIADMVCMVGDIDTGTLRSGAIPLVAVQDVFGMPATTYVVVQPPVDEDAAPVASPHRRVFEAPYVELAGALDAANLAALDADAGYLVSLATQPSVGLSYSLNTSTDGSTYEDQGRADWCPTATVVASAGPETLTVDIEGAQGLANVQVGEAALWDNEIVRVDAITDISVTLGRGCADTVPALEHMAGSRIYFYDSGAGFDLTEYANGETVFAKLPTRTATRQQSLASAAVASVAMAARAARPYPPGQVVVAGEAYPTAVDGAAVIGWADRDRVLQADQLVDADLGSIGPALDTRYAVRFLDAGAALLVEKLDMAGITATAVLNYTGAVTMQLYAINDAGDSWQRNQRTFNYTPPPGTTESSITASTWAPTEVIIDGGGDP